MQTHRARSGGRLRSELLEHRMRGALLDEACFPVAEGEMCFREERPRLRPFVRRVRLVPKGLRGDEVCDGSFSIAGSQSHRSGVFLASDECRFMAGQSLPFAGGWVT